MEFSQKIAIAKLGIVAIGLSFIIPMQIMSTNMVTFPDGSHVVADKQDAWTAYKYISNRTGEECGEVSVGWNGDVWGFASPTQYWNVNRLLFKTYQSLQDAKRAVEKFCPMEEVHAN